jgi:enoyl-CoA hydratase
MTNPLRVERHGACLVWTINRPEARNALNLEVLDLLLLAVEDAAKDRSLRAVVLTGEGKAFASGGDLHELRDMMTVQDAARFSDIGAEVCAKIEALPVPVIAALSGVAYGGGAELALACDLRVADSGAKLSFKHVRLGVTTSWGTIPRLVGLVGTSAALRLLCTAHEVSAAEAKITGIVDQITEDGGSVTTALAWASDVELGSPTAVAEMKRLVRADAAQPAVRALERERFIATWTGPDHVEAMDAYFTRRAPVWRVRG